MTEQKTAHSPGPWWVDDKLWIRAPAPDSDEEWENYVIAEVQLSEDDGTPEDEANAQLIAAAPLMLKALQELVNSDEMKSEPGYRKVQAAIKAAMGE